MRLRDMGSEAVLLAGGGRAILLQLANPAIGHAVAEHSDFDRQPTRRLLHTLGYVYALFWGTPEQAAFVRAAVNMAHAPVRSAGYDAADPALQLWVAATLYDSAILVHERIFGPLDDADADAIYQEYAEIGVALQMPRELWPADRSEFERYWRRSLAGLRVDEVTREVAARLLHPRRAAPWLRAGMPLARLLTAGLLPAELREAFGLPWSARRRRRFERALRVIRHVYPRLPRGLRQWPKNRLLRGIPGR